VSTTFATNFLAFLNELCNVESTLIAMERCKEFDEIKPELGYSSFDSDMNNFKLSDSKSAERMVLSSCTPGKINEEKSILKSGNIEIVAVSAKYPFTDVDVLKKISVKI
jgi:hypothetical protein